MNQLHRGFQVRQHNPWKMWLGLGLILFLLWGFFTLGNLYQSYELTHLELERETLLSQINELETRNYNLVQKNAQLEGSSRVEHDAYLLANDTLVNLQRQMLEQKEELAFYQGIVSPKDAALGVNIQSFELKSKTNQNEFSYKLVLTKRGEGNIKVRGASRVTIRGENNGSVSELVLTDIVLDKQSKDDEFSFRYFQVFAGDISLPDNFIPYEVEIRINPKTKKVKSFTETILWATALSEDA